MGGVKRALMLAALCLCLALGGCSVLPSEGGEAQTGPNLNLLSMQPYVDEADTSGGATEGGGAMRVDLWLGASRLMGGISAIEESLYPHSSRRYREGGFHYRLENQTGMYDEVLRELLATAEGSFTRILRFGDERLPDSAITGAGLTDGDDAEALRSLRRDMLSYAVSPMPSIFAEFSSEKMDGSYYDLGTPKLNQMARFAATNGAELENGGLVPEMSALLDTQIAAIASGAAGGYAASGDDDYPLLYALQNLDLSRLSVITFDPAELKRLSEASPGGGTLRYVERAISERGIFDAGLAVELYAMTLDYMGQLSSFCAADLAEPLVWGKLNYNVKKGEIMGALPMPRVMLMLVIGTRDDLSAYTASLNERLDANAALKALRGPEKGELQYKADGRTVTQQPFGFAYEHALISRPVIEGVTRHTAGVTVTGADGEPAQDLNGQTTVFMQTGASGTLTVALPVNKPEGDVALSLSELENARVTVTDSLLLSAELPNEPDTLAPEGDDVQAIAVRDTVYVYKRLQSPFDNAPDQSPFTLVSLTPDAGGDTLTATIAVNGAALSEGYYRLLLSADISARNLVWPQVGWIDGEQSLDATLTNAMITEWEGFTALIAQYQKGNPPSQFAHAWGEATDRSYHGTPYPDFPPVYKAPWLKELAAQLRSAANVDTISYARCVFDVFVAGVVPLQPTRE